MNKRVLKTIIVFIMMLSFLSSCATMQGIIEKPQNSAEREIFIQAIVAGGVIGATAGSLYGYTKGGKDKSKEDKRKSAAKAAGWGLAVGSIIGTVVAKYQIENLRDIELKNDRLEALLKSARQYNQKVADYNSSLQQEIIKLEKKTKAERAQIAMDQKKRVEKYRVQVKAAIVERAKLSESLVPDQKAKYQKTLRKLENEERKLIASIKELDEIYEQAIIG